MPSFQLPATGAPLSRSAFLLPYGLNDSSCPNQAFVTCWRLLGALTIRECE